MNLTQITYEQVGAVAWLTLNRPEKMNALTPVMISEWLSVLTQITKDESCRVIVVKGEGRAWSAGIDLSVFQEIKLEPGNKMFEEGMAIIRLLENCSQVTIAMLNGFCFAGAMELIMSFDLIVAAEEATIGDTHAKWGIPPKWGMTQRLQAQVGLRKAKELSFTCETLSGKDAEEIGLVNYAVPLNQLKKKVDTLIEKILPNSGEAIAGIKQVYQYGSIHTLKEGLHFERDFEMVITDKLDTLKNYKTKI